MAPPNYAFLVRNLSTGRMQTVVSTSIKSAIKAIALSALQGERYAIKFRGFGNWEYYTITATGSRKIKYNG